MNRHIQFGDWSFDADADVLRNGAAAVRIEPQVAKLLAYLVQHQDQLLSRERLLNDVWDGRIVSDDAIHRCVGILRQTLSPENKQAYIKTVPKKGYIASFPPGLADREGVEPATGHRTRQQTWAWIIGVALLAVLIVPLAFNVGGLKGRLLGGPPSGTAPISVPAQTVSIAVLPFADMSPEQDQGYFADGVSEEILNLLAQRPALRVIARTSSFSFKGQNADIATIAERLNVSHVLEGSVRKSEGRVRIVALLVEASTSAQLWSESFDRELGNILAVQSEIATEVAASLEVSLGLTSTEFSAAQQVKPEAFDLYLQGRKQLQLGWTVPLAQAERYLVESLSIEPDFLSAILSLAHTYVSQVVAAAATREELLPKLRKLEARARNLAGDSARVLGLAGAIAHLAGNRDLAERALQRALALAPSDVWILEYNAMWTIDRGHPERTVQIGQRLKELDPLNPDLRKGFAYLDLDRAEDAINDVMHYLKMTSYQNPGAWGALGHMRIILLGDVAGAVEAWEEPWERGRVSLRESGSGLQMLSTGRYALGDLEGGDAFLELATEIFPEKTFTKAAHAYRFMLAGEVESARDTAIDSLNHPNLFSRWWGGIIAMRLAVDGLIARGEAGRAVELLLDLAPEWAAYRDNPDMAPEDFYPAPRQVKSAYSSYPALYFADFIRALRAAGDETGAQTMLGHVETILADRRERGLFIEQTHVAEAHVLRGEAAAALSALERAERDRTIYNYWQVRLLYSDIFEPIRNHPRYQALVNRVKSEMRRQRIELQAKQSANHREAITAASGVEP